MPLISVRTLNSLLLWASSMASLLLIVLLLAFTWPFCDCSTQVIRKELRINKVVNQETTVQLGHSIEYNRVDPSRVIQLSWQPRAFLYRGFLSDEECDHLISLALGKKEELATNGGDSGNVVLKRLLKSSEGPLYIDDEVAARIEKRISAWTFLPKENSEPLEVVQYQFENAKQKYNYFSNKSTSKFGEPLMATVLLHLSNVTRGGELFFPESELKNSQSKSGILSDCTESSSGLRPVKGNAILFFNVHPNASPDKSSSYARCPVLEGEMWCATKFFHLRAIGRENVSFKLDGGECTDEDENCPKWASIGECQRNPIYMIGSPDYYGTCRKSCNVC